MKFHILQINKWHFVIFRTRSPLHGISLPETFIKTSASLKDHFVKGRFFKRQLFRICPRKLHVHSFSNLNFISRKMVGYKGRVLNLINLHLLLDEICAFSKNMNRRKNAGSEAYLIRNNEDRKNAKETKNLLTIQWQGWKEEKRRKSNSHLPPRETRRGIRNTK